MAIQNLDLRSMLRQFGVVTVMDVEAYAAKRYIVDDATKGIEAGEWDAKSTFVDESGVKRTPLFSLKTLKIANINTEGPTKTATGGQNADVLLKYGKTFTIEMQDALGKYEVLKHIYGANDNGSDAKGADIVAITDGFPGELTLVGKTFVVDKKTGAKQPIYIVIPFYLGDGIFNLTQDAEGDISVFDMNGNILRFSNGSANADQIANDESSVYGKLYDKGADNQFYFFASQIAIDMLYGGAEYTEVWAGGAIRQLVLDCAADGYVTRYVAIDEDLKVKVKLDSAYTWKIDGAGTNLVPGADGYIELTYGTNENVMLLVGTKAAA